MPDPREDQESTRSAEDRARYGARDEVARSGGLADTDDTTEADQGMPGGAGAAPTEGATQPVGTEPLADEEDQGEAQR